MVTPNEDMGPLPKGDRQDTLQQLSLQALRSRLPVDMFLFRRESEDDKGTDGTLEAKLRGRFTNCRANVQVKSTDKPDRNLDGSVSYPIEGLQELGHDLVLAGEFGLELLDLAVLGIFDGLGLAAVVETGVRGARRTPAFWSRRARCSSGGPSRRWRPTQR